jgi:hypothetical protein
MHADTETECIHESHTHPVCMCRCVYVCRYTHPVCMCRCVYVCRTNHIHTLCVCVDVCMCVGSWMHADIETERQTHIHTERCVCMCVYTERCVCMCETERRRQGDRHTYTQRDRDREMETERCVCMCETHASRVYVCMETERCVCMCETERRRQGDKTHIHTNKKTHTDTGTHKWRHIDINLKTLSTCSNACVRLRACE